MSGEYICVNDLPWSKEDEVKTLTLMKNKFICKRCTQYDNCEEEEDDVGGQGSRAAHADHSRLLSATKPALM